MFFTLKLIQKLISPLGLALIGFLLVFCYAGRPGRKLRIIASLGFLALFFPSLPLISTGLLEQLERETPAIPLSEVPACEVLVVLGGTASPQRGETLLAEELAGSRLLMAVRLYRLGKAQKILVTSGIGYLAEDGTPRTESDDMREILITMGIPSETIILESQAMNTEENASYSAQLLQKQGLSKEIILVSSAYHMPRALRWFQQEGLNVHAVGAGRSSRPGALEAMDFIPSAAALSRSTGAIKEYLGLLPIYYQRLTE